MENTNGNFKENLVIGIIVVALTLAMMVMKTSEINKENTRTRTGTTASEK